MKKSQLNKLIKEEVSKALNEFTRRYFEIPEEKNVSAALEVLSDWGFGGVVRTNLEAIERISQYEGDTMFVHIQYHELKDRWGNEIRLHQTQYYNREKPSVNVTKVQVQDMSGPEGTSARAVGEVLVETDVFLDELTKQENFQITKRAS